ncbi:MAG TPA: hypothetical protein P5234_16500 [Thermoanaerobaculaceae bacterium]|nr:hypothetical protein [Thermoanaerobaculaceae bacterium]HRS17840.1 hypothetical protein [Thermoanaerobaculaceae bacterium]
MDEEIVERGELFKSIGEVAAVAVVYSALGLSLGVMKASPPTALRLAAVLLVNLVVVAAASWYVTHTIGNKWVAAFGAASVMTATQLLLPRLELALEARSGLRGMALLAVLGGITALVAACGLVLAFGPPDVFQGPEPAVWLPLHPLEYLWRLPVLVAGYAALHVVAIEAARAMGPAGRADTDLGDLVVARLVAGAVWVGAIAVCTLSLEGRLGAVVRALAAMVVIGGLAGRLMLYLRASIDIWFPRTLFPSVADLVAVLAACLLLLPPAMPVLEEEEPVEELT